MKNFAGTYILALVVGLTAGYVYFFQYKKHQEQVEQKEKNAIVFKAEKEKLTHLELVRSTGPLVLEKKDGAWRLTAPVQDLADDAAVSSFIDSLLQERSQEVVAEGDGVVWPTFGLDQPSTRLVAKTSDGVSYEIKIGSVKSYDDQLYARVNDEKKVLLVTSSWDAHLTKLPKDLRDKRLLRSDKGDYAGIRITRREGAPGVVLDKIDGKWVLKQGGDPTIPLSKAAVDSYLEKVRALQADDFVNEDKSGADAKKFGVGPNSSVLKIELVSAPDAGEKAADNKAKTAGVAPTGSFVLEVSAVKPSQIDKDKKADDETYRFAVSSDSPAIFRIQKMGQNDLNQAANDFYDKRFPFKVVAPDVAEFRINTPELKLEAKKEGDTWVAEGVPEGKEIDSAKVTEVLERIGGLEAVRFLGNAPAKGVNPDKNKIELLSAKGTQLLLVNWGDLLKEKDTSGADAQRYHVKSNLAEQALLVSEGSIQGLSLKDILKDKAKDKEKNKPKENVKSTTSTAPSGEHGRDI